jgi:hypothetical protein
MHHLRFDAAARLISTLRSRRALAPIVGGLLGAAIGLEREPVGARRCPPCRKKKRGRCRGKKRDGTPCPGGDCRNGRCQPPTCADGVRNGSESDVDCGGTCPRCPDGKSCAGRADCLSARCDAGRCQACAIDADCGSDANGPCVCDVTADGGRACGSSLSGRRVDTCADCLPTEHCYDPGSPTRCYLDCGQTP